MPRLSETERAGLLQQSERGETGSAVLRAQVLRCRELQRQRQGTLNARLPPEALRQHCVLDPADLAMLNAALTRLKLSARASLRILRITRTLADLDGASGVRRAHLLEAINYRRFDMQ